MLQKIDEFRKLEDQWLNINLGVDDPGNILPIEEFKDQNFNTLVNLTTDFANTLEQIKARLIEGADNKALREEFFKKGN